MPHLMPHKIIVHTRTMPQGQWGSATFEEREHTIETYAVAEALGGWNKSHTQWYPASIVDTTILMLTEGRGTALYIGPDGASDSEPTPDTYYRSRDHDPITAMVTEYTAHLIGYTPRQARLIFEQITGIPTHRPTPRRGLEEAT